jgi:hypothetical protein
MPFHGRLGTSSTAPPVPAVPIERSQAHIPKGSHIRAFFQ